MVKRVWIGKFAFPHSNNQEARRVYERSVIAECIDPGG